MAAIGGHLLDILSGQGAGVLLGAVMFAAVGCVIATRRPDNSIGWLLIAIAFGESLTILSSGYAGLISRGGIPPGADVVAWISAWIWMPELGLIATFLFLLFPTGHLPSPRWRPFAWATALLLAAGVSLLAAFSWQYRGPDLLNGFPSTPTLNILFPAFAIAVGVCMVVCVGSLFVRYRHGDAALRRQLKWILGGTVLLAVGVVASFDVFPGPTVLASVITCIGIVGFVATVGIATLRYRLFDIDLVISRTLVYGSLAALITGVYVGIAVGIGELVGSGGKPNLGLSILATAIVAVGFQPARERLQRVANRLVYGKRATPYQVLSEFSSHVAGSYAADEVLPRMARVLQEGTGGESAGVWLRSGTDLVLAAAWPEDAARGLPRQVGVGRSLSSALGATRSVEVRHQGDLLGALTVVKRRGESLTPVEERLLDDLAHQAGLVLKNVGLTADLQRRLEELRASRQRLVSAQDEERRRLERNLHDGAQQHLVALKVKLGLAEMLTAKDPDKAKATIAQLKLDTDEALETLRDLARGIYPPLLAEKGLVTALQSQAGKATVPVQVDADGICRYPQEAEATVYFCVLEALQNVQKYANATHVRVRLQDADGVLRFEVEDDGRGFDAEHVRKGAGLTNMQDRLDALGGSLEITSVPAHGTRVRATLVGSAAAALAAGAADETRVFV